MEAAYLSLMAFGFAMQMQKAITIGTQISTNAAEDNSQSFRIIVVVTKRLKTRD